jgi:hypothetical protein
VRNRLVCLARFNNACNRLKHPGRFSPSNGTGSKLLNQDDAVCFNIPGEHRHCITALKQLSADAAGPTAVKSLMTQCECVHPEVPLKYRVLRDHLCIIGTVGEGKLAQNRRSVLQLTGFE